MSYSTRRPKQSLLAFVAPLLLMIGSCQEASDLNNRPDVLLVVLDTVRRDHITPCNSRSGLTPNLNRLAKEGTTFCRMVAPGSWTLPVHGSIFTGHLPRHHGADFVDPFIGGLTIGDFAINPLDDRLPTLAELYRSAGYHTIFISENPMLNRRLGMVRGFDVFRGSASYDLDSRGKAYELLENFSDEKIDRPKFIVVNLMAAHQPYLKEHGGYREIWPFEGSSDQSLFYRFVMGKMKEDERHTFLSELKKAYEEDVRRADEDLGKILSLLEEREWIDRRSLIAVTSDHGEHLGEFGLLDHGRSVHRVNTDVFAVIRLPNARRIDKPVHRLVQSQDLFVTLLRKSGVNPPRRPYATDLFSDTESRIAITTSEPDRAWQKLTEGHFGADSLLAVQRDNLRIVRINDSLTLEQEVPGVLPEERETDATGDLEHLAHFLDLPSIRSRSSEAIDDEFIKVLRSSGYIH